MAKSAITTYGEALFQIAVESSSCLPMLEEVTELKKILSDNPELGSVMLNPRFSKEEHSEIISNVFKGSIKKGTLYIGEEKLCKNKAFKEDKDVYVGIRPEGFLCDEHTKEEDKVRSLDVQAIQTMGRDMSLVCDSACKDGDAVIKIIIDSEIKVGVGVNKFAIRPTKMFVFDGKSEERIYLED